MVQKFKEGMILDKVAERILWLSILFFIIFFGTTILSYFLLPEGLLLGKNRISDFKTSENLFLCTAQIFLYNMLSVAFIFVGSMFTKRNEGENAYRSYGRIGFFVFILLNAVTLGTWSFALYSNGTVWPKIWEKTLKAY